MKKKIRFSCLIILAIIFIKDIKAQNIAITDDNGYTADPTAMLDVKSTAKGMLIPRLTTVQIAAISNPATGLLVFDTNTNSFWFNEGTPATPVWVEIAVCTNTWLLTGNSATVDGTNFIGTTDNVPLNFRVNNEKAGRIDPTYFNAFFGYFTGNNNTIGSHNTAVGNDALKANTTGSQNAAIGCYSLALNTTGSGNTAMGFGTLAENISGNQNTAVGYDALLYNSIGNCNTSTGDRSLHFNTSGSWNTAYGLNSMQHNTTGNYNTAIGLESGFNNTVGSSNVFIGYRAGYNETGSNKLYIANSEINPPLIYGDFSNGNVGVGTTSPGAKFTVNGICNNSITEPIGIIESSTIQTPFYLYSNGNFAAGIKGDGSGNASIFSGAGNIYFNTGMDGTTTHGSSRLTILNNGNVGIGSTSPQGALDVTSTTGGLVVPRMTTAERDALTAINGTIIYNTTTNAFNFYENSAWVTK